jgi:hypothetical protein
MKPKKKRILAIILSEFFGIINEETKERILFALMDTGHVVPCLVSHELSNAPIQDGDIVLLEFKNMETAMIWTTSSYCVVEIIDY